MPHQNVLSFSSFFFCFCLADCLKAHSPSLPFKNRRDGKGEKKKRMRRERKKKEMAGGWWFRVSMTPKRILKLFEMENGNKWLEGRDAMRQSLQSE